MKYLDDLTLDQLSGLVRTLRQNQCAIATSWSYAQLNSGQWEHIYDVDDPSWQDGIPGGLRVPRLIATSKQAPIEIALWFEDVGEKWAEKWSVARYAEAAYHFGHFNGHYAGRPPSEPWLGREPWRSYIEGECTDCIGYLAQHRDHPDVLAVYPRSVQQQLFALARREFRPD